MRRAMKVHVVLLSVALMLPACATQQYTSSSPMVQVGPSKMWHKTGVSGKEAWETWQQCLNLPGDRKVTNACMKERGFKYGRTDDIYIPPRPPEKGWMRPGTSYVEALDFKSKCLAREYSQEYLNRCMGEQGFVYRELSEEELP